MYKVALVDDEQIILNGLIRVIPWASYDCEVVATAADGLLGAAMVRELKPDILMTDIRMPNMDGLAMIAALRSEFPAMQITVLTAFRDFEYAQKAIRLGVCRYLLKPSKMPELQEAIEAMVARLGPVTADAADGEKDDDAGCFVVQQAMAFMRAHCSEHLRLADVAEHVYVSQWHLSKLINRHSGQSFLGLLSEMRVERAKELLLEPGLKVHEVAARTGFQDVAHFSKTFKRLCGCTPVEYRQSPH